MTLGGNAPAGSQIGLDGSADLAWAIATAWPLVQCVCVCVFLWAVQATTPPVSKG